MRANIVFKIQYGQIYSDFSFEGITEYCNLKSNMDRFIVIPTAGNYINYVDLKSNMDRFIGLGKLTKKC